MVWYTYQMQNLINDIIEKNVAVIQAVEELEIALVNQKGFVSYYFLDGDPEWLERLGEYRKKFKERLHEARLRIQTEQQREAIDRIESEYLRYANSKDQVITHYKAGSRQLGATLHQKVRNHFFKVLDLTHNFKKMEMEKINQAKDRSYTQAKQLRIIATTAVVAVFFLGVLLAFILTAQILGPVRRLALKADPEGNFEKPKTR